MLLICLGGGALCAPARADLWSDFEDLVGRLSSEEMAQTTGRVKSPLLERWVTDLGARLTTQTTRPHLQYRFAILDTYEENAFALPGGYVWVTRGLLHHVNSDEELAGVLAHELAHSTDRDFARYLRLQLIYLGVQAILKRDDKESWVGVAQVLQVLDTLRHSRRYEGQADRHGLELAFRAGFDPTGLVDFLGTINDDPSRLERLLASHPPGPERVRAARERVTELRRGDYHAVLAIAREAAEAGHLSRAAANYQAATQLWPDNPEPWLALAEVQERRGLVKAARSAYQAVLNRQADNEAALRGQQALTRTGQRPLLVAELPAEQRPGVQAALDQWQQADKTQRSAAQRLYGVLRQFTTDGRIAEGLQAAQLLAPEYKEPRYLAALASAYLVLQRSQRTGRLVEEVYRQGLVLRAAWPQVGRDLLRPAKVPEMPTANRERLVAVAPAFADQSAGALAVADRLFDDGSRAGQDLVTGTRMVSAAFLTLVTSGSRQPLGRLSYARFLLLEGDIAYGGRLVDRAAEHAKASLAEALTRYQDMAVLSLDTAEARATSAQRALYRGLVARRLGVAESGLPAEQALGQAAAAALQGPAPGADLEDLQVRCCLLRMCNRDVGAERVEPEAF